LLNGTGQKMSYHQVTRRYMLPLGSSKYRLWGYPAAQGVRLAGVGG
jgi:hypothetical protein